MAWTLVQKSAAEAVTNPGTTVTPTLPVASTAGNLLVCTLTNASGSATWTLPAGWTGGIAAGLHAGTTGTGTDIWYYPANPGGISSVLCTSSGSATLKAALAEYNPGSSPAVNPNPGFESDVSGWLCIGGTFTQSSAYSHTGTFSGLLTPDGVTLFPQITSWNSCVPGVTYTFAPWLKAASSFNIGVGFAFFDGAGNQLHSADIATLGTATTTPAQFSVTQTAPAGAAVFFSQVFLNGTPAPSVTLAVDDAAVTVQRLSAAGTGIAAAVASCPVTTGTAAGSGDMAVCCFHQNFTVAKAITWTDPAGFTVIQSDSGTTQHHMYGGYKLSVPAGSVTVTGTSSVNSDSQNGWGGVAAAFSTIPPVAEGSGSGPGRGGQVGAWINPVWFGTGTTLAQAITTWQNLTSRPLTARRVYFGTFIPAGITADLSADAAAGRLACLSFIPPSSPPDPAAAAALDTFLASCKNAGLNAKVALYHEAAQSGMTAAQAITATRFYAPTIRQYYPLVFVTSTYAVLTLNENSYYSGDAYIDEIATDFYCSGWLTGQTLDLAASVADKASPPKPFGLWEFNASTVPGGPTQAQGTAFFGYIQTYFTGRIAAGKNNADLLFFNSGTNTVTNPVTTAGDYRIGLYQNLFDALSPGGKNTASLAAELDVILNITESLTTAGAAVPDTGAAGPRLPGWPALILEAALAPAAPVALLGTFILDDPVAGRLDAGRFGDTSAYVDITGFLRTVTTSRPSTRVQGPLIAYQAGTLSAVLDNSDGRFDPDNTASPYAAAGRQIRAMLPVRIRALLGAAEYPLFSGFADGWQPSPVTYEGGYAELNLGATDGFKILQGQNLAPLASPAGGSESSGARIRRILTAAGWYTDHRKVAGGDSQVQATSFGDSPLNLLQLTADTEIGELYIDGGGNVVFRNRHAVLSDSRSVTPQAVFGDLDGTSHPAGTELALASVSRASDDTTLANDVQITRAGGVMQESSNPALIALYLFPRTYERSDVLLTTDTEALAYAQWVRYVSQTGENRFEQITVDPLADPANLFPQVLGREIGDRIQVWHRPANVPSPVVRDCFIRGITHDIDVAGGTWLTTWTLQDAARYANFLILDSAAFGLLNSQVLAY